jgi:hypothetical protein
MQIVNRYTHNMYVYDIYILYYSKYVTNFNDLQILFTYIISLQLAINIQTMLNSCQFWLIFWIYKCDIFAVKIWFIYGIDRC